FYIGCITTWRTYEGVFAILRDSQEFLACRTAHGARHRMNDDVFEAESVEDLDIRIAMGGVGLRQALIVDVEGIGILHHELTSAQQAPPRARLRALLVI